VHHFHEGTSSATNLLNPIAMDKQLVDVPELSKSSLAPKTTLPPAACCAPSAGKTECCTPSASVAENEDACCAQPADGSSCCVK
jgi:hypothetical protein